MWAWWVAAVLVVAASIVLAVTIRHFLRHLKATLASARELRHELSSVAQQISRISVDARRRT